ncbi:MAG: hypothetical protein ACLQLH_14495 [Terracidiphilus sp.]
MPQNLFEISTNHVHKTLVGHRQGCSQAQKYGGGTDNRIQEHYEGLGSAEEAELVMLKIVEREPQYTTDWCAFCCGDLKIAATRYSPVRQHG